MAKMRTSKEEWQRRRALGDGYRQERPTDRGVKRYRLPDSVDPPATVTGAEVRRGKKLARRNARAARKNNARR